MNKRTNAIVQILCKKETNSIASLAQEFALSQRTIRNDLNVINEILNEHGLEQICLGKGGSIFLPENFADVWQYIVEKDFYEYKLSKEERKIIASAMLVCTSGYLTLSMIAEELVVSRATIINDLEDIKQFIRQGNLEVVSHPNKGLRIEGKESDKRVFLMQLGKVEFEQLRQDFLRKQIRVDEHIENILEKILFEQEHVHQCFLNDVSFQRIVMYLGIMVNRENKGEYIEHREYQENSKYLMAKDILQYVCQYCSMTTTEDEIIFLSELLSFAGYMKQENISKSTMKIQVAARKFIERVSEALRMNLNNDFDFFESLSAHLERSVDSERIQDADHAILQDALKDNPEIMDAVYQGQGILNQCLKRELSKSEMGYIAVHVCAAVERKKNKEIVFHVIFACHAGIGTSHLLLEKLKKHFNFQIVDIVSAHEACRLEADAADLVISTVPLKDCKMRYVIVSPRLKDEDYIRIGNVIDELRNDRHLPLRVKKKEVNAKGLLERIGRIVYEMVPEEAASLMQQLCIEVNEYFGEQVENPEEFAPTLTQALSASHIQWEVEAGDWKNAIYKSAEKLLQLGYVEERYVDAMIENVIENGPYFIIAPGFAVPHAGIEEGCLKMGMNMIHLKEPVYFEEGEEYKVDFLCCFSAIDKKMHMKAFFNLVNMLKEENFLTELRMCESEKDALDVIQRYESIVDVQ